MQAGIRRCPDAQTVLMIDTAGEDEDGDETGSPDGQGGREITLRLRLG